MLLKSISFGRPEIAESNTWGIRNELNKKHPNSNTHF